jgi:hypothetical protein
MTEQYGPPPGGGYYPPMPGGNYAPPPSERGPAPGPVRLAVNLMLLQALLGVVSWVVQLSTRSSLRRELRNKNPDETAAQINHLVNTAIAVALVIGVVFLVLYVLLAFQVRKGKNWARIVTWVLAGIGVLALVGTAVGTEPVGTRIFGFVGGLIDLVIVVSLARPLSNQYFRRRPPGY